MVRKNNTRLTLKERVQIETLLNENKTKAYIAKTLNRSRSTVSREVNKWVKNKSDKYSADLANWNAKDNYLNKRNRDKISTHKKLRFYIFKALLKGWTPEQIAGRLKEDYPNDVIMSISHESIYRYIYLMPQARLNKKLIKLFVRHKSRRRTPKKRRRKGSKILNQISIDNRPKHIDLRQEIGHWEGDLVIGKNHKSAIGTIVERKSRDTLIIKLEAKNANEVAKKFSQKLNTLNPLFKKSMTYDNGTEMAKHKLITQKNRHENIFCSPLFFVGKRN